MANKKKIKTRNRASKLRAKMKAGAEMSVAELEFLREYELNKGKPGRPKKEAGDAEEDTTKVNGATDAEPEESEDEDEGDDRGDVADDPNVGEVPGSTAAGATGAAPAAATAPVDVPAPTAPPPRPPRIKIGAPPRTSTRAPDADEPKSGSKGDWRAKYKDGFGGVGGREATVTELAKVWTGILESLCEGMREAGIEPRMDPKQLYPSIVLVVDEVLPPHVELTPKMVAVGGTTVLVVQRFMNRKAIADVEKKKRDAADLSSRTAERRARVDDIAEQPAAAPATPDPVEPPTERAPVNDNDRSGFEPVNGIPRMSSEALLERDPSAVV
jgi:hypothetical protein